MQDVFEEALVMIDTEAPAALSTIVSSSGSLPMSKKAKMLVKQDGTIVGTVGGGCLEADVWAEAREVMASGEATLQKFILTEKHAGDSGLNCGGNVEIFTEPLLATSRDVYAEIAGLRAQRKPAVLATRVSGGAEAGHKLLIRGDGSVLGTLGDASMDRAVIEELGSPEGVSEDLLMVMDLEGASGPEPDRAFLESITPDPTLYLFGGGHVSFAIARLAATVGFRIVVVDDRPAFSNKERFPMADETLVLDLETAFDRLDVDDRSYLVAVTRGHQYDKPIVEQAVTTSATYVGMIGSRRKIALMWKELEAKGIPREQLEAVHAPIGLDIGADNPEEIAVSVVAELINHRRQGGKPAHAIGSLSGSQGAPA